MKFLKRLFRKSQLLPVPARDNDGRFLPHRVAVRKKSIELAIQIGRPDLAARLRQKGLL